MAIVLDADVIIRAERAGFGLHQLSASLPDEDFQIAAITVAELWHGVERASVAYKLEREEYVIRILSALQLLPYSETTARLHARVWAELESSGKMIGYHDLIVASTALEQGSAVATFNERHFTKVRGLRVIRPR